MHLKPAFSHPEVVLLTEERDEILAERDLYRKQLSEALSDLKLRNNEVLDLRQQYNDLSSELADVKRKLARERLQFSAEIVHSQGEEVVGGDISSNSSSTSLTESNTVVDGKHGVSFFESQATGITFGAYSTPELHELARRGPESDKLPRAISPLPADPPRAHTPLSVTVDEGASAGQMPLQPTPTTLAPLPLTVSPPMPTQDHVLPFAESDSIQSPVGKQTKKILKGFPEEQYETRQGLVKLASQTQHEADAQTMKDVVNVTYETFIKGKHPMSDYSAFCCTTMSELDSKVQDSGGKDAAGNPIGGGKLFKKLLLERLQADFEKWVSISSVYHPASKEICSASSKWDAEDELGTGDVQYSAEILRLLEMLGNLSCRRMVPEWVILGCMEKLLTISEAAGASASVCIEGLCTLLFSAGKALHTMKARGRMDVCFERMRELVWPQSPYTKDVGIDMKGMLRTLIDFRRHWMP